MPARTVAPRWITRFSVCCRTDSSIATKHADTATATSSTGTARWMRRRNRRGSAGRGNRIELIQDTLASWSVYEVEEPSHRGRGVRSVDQAVREIPGIGAAAQ